MPSPDEQGAKKQPAPERAEIPKPAFGLNAKAPAGLARPAKAANDAAVVEPVIAPPAAQTKPPAPAPPAVLPEPAAPVVPALPVLEPKPQPRAEPVIAPPPVQAPVAAPSIPIAMDEPEPVAQIAAERAEPESESELDAVAIGPAPVVVADESPAPAVALPVIAQAAVAVEEAPPVPFGDPIDQSEDRSAVKVWDFATGVRISPVTPAYQGLETNDNGEAAPAAIAEVGAEPAPEPVLVDQPESAAVADEVDAPMEIAVAPEPQLAAEPIPADTDTSEIAHSETVQVVDTVLASEEIDASQSSSPQDSARVWDFATGKPLHPAATAQASEPVTAAPQVESEPQTEAPAATPATAAEKIEPTATPKARVWDFATGKPLYEDAEALAPASPQRAHSGAPLVISPQDELILEVKVKGVDASDTIIAYGTPDGVYLPLGTMARILDLALTVSDDGHYAHGWLLEEDRVLSIDLRQGILEFEGRKLELDRSLVAAFEGEMYLHIDQFARFLPIEIKADLRSMAVLITTLQPFPFELRAQREAQRKRLEAREGRPEGREYERVDLPWEAVSVPAADVELRAVSDSGNGPRIEGDLRLAGDLGYLTAVAFLSGETKNGLTASLLELGRVDPDGELLGPLKATAFSFGDVSTESMPLGLRSVSGRGFNVTNAESQLTSVFDRVDLRGILPTGYEVELYRNEVLIGSTREAVNGQYEFLQVPVDFGLNVFRLVFYGPQGQRSESVRRISVGDGRVAKGKLVYNFGAAQRERNLLGVTPPDFIPPREYGEWRAGGQLAYGVSEGLTALLSGAWFEREGDRWVTSAGIRTGISGLAVKGDVGIADGGATALAGGIGGRFGASAVTLSHTEYSGLFPDETKFIGLQYLRRATEVDFNTTLKLGNEVSGLVVPPERAAAQLYRGRRARHAAGFAARFNPLLRPAAVQHARLCAHAIARFRSERAAVWQFRPDDARQFRYAGAPLARLPAFPHHEADHRRSASRSCP
ncbi:hypothetical protein [Altererythrobacter sp. BO-6]|uniref:hypothetical protein n=1 Tax=Altererythrobacter sp. BO-6 TaxID=2604537 RepID=UPI0019D247F8|nr:hypothetical protein [Altererythrobacter sp. BO-6]